MKHESKFFTQELFLQLDMETLRDPSPAVCPDECRLLEYADKSLLAKQQAAVRQHLATCSECARLMTQMQRVCAPIVRIHDLPFLSLAALHLRQRGQLNPGLEEAWGLHRSKCARCAKRAATLQRWNIRTGDTSSTPKPVLQPSALALSFPRTWQRAPLVLAFSMGLLVMKFGMPPAPPQPVKPASNTPISTELTERSLPDEIDLSAEGALKGLMLPAVQNASRLRSQFRTWNNLPSVLEMQKQTCLGGLYVGLASTEKNPAERQKQLISARQSLLKARAEIDKQLNRLPK